MTRQLTKQQVNTKYHPKIKCRNTKSIDIYILFYSYNGTGEKELVFRDQIRLDVSYEHVNGNIEGFQIDPKGVQHICSKYHKGSWSIRIQKSDIAGKQLGVRYIHELKWFSYDQKNSKLYFVGEHRENVNLSREDRKINLTSAGGFDFS